MIMNDKLIVALTGGIGSGKSTVADRLAERGAVIIDADVLAREVVAPGTEVLARIVREFGDDILQPDGTLARAALADIVFADPEARQRLERITHPPIRERFERRADAAPAGSVVVNEIPLLHDRAQRADYDLVIVVGAPDHIRLQRLVGRGLDESAARARMDAQISDAQRAELADVWVDNDRSEDDLLRRVDLLWDEMLAPAAARRAAYAAAGIAACLCMD